MEISEKRKFSSASDVNKGANRVSDAVATFLYALVDLYLSGIFDSGFNVFLLTHLQTCQYNIVYALPNSFSVFTLINPALRLSEGVCRH